MANASVKDFSKTWWVEVYNRIIGAAVFLDDASAECLHWDGGLMNMINGGAVAVKCLSPFEFASKEQKKGVFISETTQTQLQSIRDIIKHSNFTHVILISTVSLDIVYTELNEGKDVTDVISSGKVHSEANKQLEKLLMEWINKKQCSVEVVHVPVFTIALTNGAFVTPAFNSLVPSFKGQLVPDSPSLDLYSLSDEERSRVRRLASNINSMLDSMDLKEDIFYMGAFSSLLAGVLENSPICTARRKVCTNPSSLIIVDRTLDLCGVTTHSMESILDKAMAVLPRFPGHATDLAVNMSPLCEANVISPTEESGLSPGCLYHAGDESCVQTYDYMINKSQKEVMFHLYNKLSYLDVLKSPTNKTLLKVTPQTVENIVTAAKGKYEVISRHLGLVQQALAVVQTLKSPAHAQLELLMSLEKQVLQNIATSRDSTSVLNQISHLIKTRKDRNLCLERLLALIVHIYSLAGTEISFSKDHEDNLQEALSVAIFEDYKLLYPESVESGHVATTEECSGIASKVMKKLKDVSNMRRILNKYQSVLKPCEGGNGWEYRGVLQQLIEELLEPERAELTDLKHRSEGIKDLLRSGFNILMSNSNKKSKSKHPLDNPTVIMLIIGGVTCEELKRLHRSAMTSGSDAHLIVGSTALVTPVQAMRRALDL